MSDTQLTELQIAQKNLLSAQKELEAFDARLVSQENMNEINRDRIVKNIAQKQLAVDELS